MVAFGAEAFVLEGAVELEHEGCSRDRRPDGICSVQRQAQVLLLEIDREARIAEAVRSGDSLFGLDEMMARYASYETFAEIIRHRFTVPKDTLRELFSRIIFNINCGNTDDHARNHSAFWNGKSLDLTPAYDICPQARAGNEASQAMLISGSNNLSQLKTCLETAHNFLLSQDEASWINGEVIRVDGGEHISGATR